MQTIKSSAEITNLFNEGRRVGTKDLTLIALRNGKQHGHCGRAAFIAGKKLGNAVWRNRAKRRMRALCQAVGGPVPGYDIVFLAKKSTTTADYRTMLSHLESALKRLDPKPSKETPCRGEP